MSACSFVLVGLKIVIIIIIARDVSRVVGGELGLALSVSKCELIACDCLTVTDSSLQSFPGVKIGWGGSTGCSAFARPGAGQWLGWSLWRSFQGGQQMTSDWSTGGFDNTRPRQPSFFDTWFPLVLVMHCWTSYLKKYLLKESWIWT